MTQVTQHRVFLYSSDVGRLTHEDDFATEEEAKACVENWIGDRDWNQQKAAGMFKIEPRLNSHLKGKWVVNVLAQAKDWHKDIREELTKLNPNATESELIAKASELRKEMAAKRKTILRAEFDVYETAKLEVDRAVDEFLMNYDDRTYMRIQRAQRAAGVQQRFITDPSEFGLDIHMGEYAIRWQHDSEVTPEELRAIRFRPAGYSERGPERSFSVTSGALRVTDPCYSMETWCAGQIENVKNGHWLASVGRYTEEMHEYRLKHFEESIKSLEDVSVQVQQIVEEMGVCAKEGEEGSEEHRQKRIERLADTYRHHALQDLNRYGNPDDWGGRVAYLHIRHADVEPVLFNENHFQFVEGLDVGVDSGQAGFFDLEQFKPVASPENGNSRRRDGSPFEVFYEEACDRTLNDPERFGIVRTWGAVSSSGFGDGSYACFVRRDQKGDIIEARIVFISDGDEEEEDEDDE